jgi:alkyl hydroperoxide reductase subunit AhpF
MSGLKEQLPDDLMKRIQSIKKDIHIQVFISLTCPYCPDAVSVAHRLALESEHIKADMVESSTFVPVAIKYNVSSVPKTVINGTQEFVGANPLGKVLDFIEKV